VDVRCLFVRISPDNATWQTCGTTAGRNYLGNSSVETVACAAQADWSDLYVRLETTTLSPALVYLRTLQVDAQAPCY
jgi:hypothetical protein